MGASGEAPVSLCTVHVGANFRSHLGSSREREPTFSKPSGRLEKMGLRKQAVLGKSQSGGQLLDGEGWSVRQMLVDLV